MSPQVHRYGSSALRTFRYTPALTVCGVKARLRGRSKQARIDRRRFQPKDGLRGLLNIDRKILNEPHEAAKILLSEQRIENKIENLTLFIYPVPFKIQCLKSGVYSPPLARH